MPELCKLETKDADGKVLVKEYDNDKNRYASKNFFDIYCHCDQPFDGERDMAPGKFMLQCYNCEDWIHNDHLMPPQMKPISEDYILICRKCSHKNSDQ
jgi:hypothetical protein